jgi:hypothetical protein
VTQPLTYRAAVPDDEGGILGVFGEVAAEVPTAVRPQTEAIIHRFVSSGASLVAIDGDGKVIGYALAESDGNGGISLMYLGVAKAARSKRICSSIISQLKKHGMPITASVRHNNKSSMADRFKHLEFTESEVREEETKFRWEPKAD